MRYEHEAKYSGKDKFIMQKGDNGCFLSEMFHLDMYMMYNMYVFILVGFHFMQLVR